VLMVIGVIFYIIIIWQLAQVFLGMSRA